ncbi:Putative ribosomal N-acetyltransferase YdaF [Streptomyces sp. ADI95-16]|uniref:GNAT family N-acetyltransferase n=1 Tax=Streptomyces sp. ADI95-16 TaxID=1522758 RepID=UPI000F3A8FC4|nr:GNAT family N-acetyltransferase [Streptomyces sp. ADI95-16]AYV29725.1 Putative ribosomal N-acetyltransferase YdaF [Streptomyces sp. ADI95-16]
MEPVTLTSERLAFRPLEPRDAPVIAGAWRDPAIRRWTTVPEPGTEDQAMAFVSRTCASGWADDTNYIFGTHVRETGELIGVIGVFGLSWVCRSENLASMGAWAVPGQRGLGYTVEAVRRVARWVFEDLRMDRVESVIEVGNDASLAVVRKAGFVLEGTLRSRVIQHGTRRDAWLTSLLPQDAGVAPQLPYSEGRMSPPAAHPASSQVSTA